MRPILTRSEITGSVYITTKYKALGNGEFDTFEKYDVTEEFDAIAGHIVEENAKLREQLKRVQPTDCEGNVLDIADTVHMLRSEYDGDHEWEDVVTELVLTKWGGDRWIVRGSKGEAWACDCAKTGYDEDAYEASDDVEPLDEPTLLEVENAKLRELVHDMYGYAFNREMELCNECACADDGDCEACGEYDGACGIAKRRFEELYASRIRALGIEVR